LYTGRGKHAKKIFFVKSYPQNTFWAKFTAEAPDERKLRHELQKLTQI